MDSTKRKSFNANVDLIHGPIFKSLIIFALPTIYIKYLPTTL